MPREDYSRIVRRYEPREPWALDSASALLVSVIIPARDEANSIGSLISKIKESLSGYSHEIIVVDDASKDATREIASRNGTIVISHKENLGKGTAMKRGAQNASGSVIVFLDGDGAHNPDDITSIIAPILQAKADFVIGSRALPESKVSVSPLSRRLTNNLASFIISGVISFLLPLVTLFKCPVKWIKVTDCTSGFRAIKRDAWQKLNLASRGFQIETEMIYEAARKRLVIVEAPISCNWNKELSRLSILRDSLRTLKLLAGRLIDEVGK